MPYKLSQFRRDPGNTHSGVHRVVYGLGFMAVQLVAMEEALHGNPTRHFSYALNETLGYSALICFLVGYLWLVFAVTNMA